MGGRTNQVTYGCLGRSLKFYYLRVEGLTKPPASALVQNLSPSTCKWKDELSHLCVPCSKIKVLLPTGGRTNQATSKCLGTKFMSFFLRVEEQTKSRVSWSKFKFFYQRVEGWTKSLTGALVQNLSPSTYGWKDKPSHTQVSWSKFKFYYQRVEGQTKLFTSSLVKILSPTTYWWKD